MFSISTLLLCSTLAVGSDTVLLEFSSQRCGPCRMMQPTVQRLYEEGFPVRQIDIDQNPQWAAQYGVQAIPCFIMVVDGRVVDRLEGATSYDRLRQMLGRGEPQVGDSPGMPVRGQSPEDPWAGAQAAPAPQPQPQPLPIRQLGISTPAVPAPPAPDVSLDPPALDRQTLIQDALAATVRLRVHDGPDSSGVGTGTIVDVHGRQALVLTCAHIFRQSQGRGKIEVELFVPGAGPVIGQVLDYDLERDVALVVIEPPVAVKPMPIASPREAPRAGDEVFSIGCNQGADPSPMAGRVIATDRSSFSSHPLVEVTGAPIDGRSGGGLFSADGKLIGVCNAADREGNRGMYASLATIEQHLGNNNLAQIIRSGDDRTQTIAAEPAPSDSPATIAPLQPISAMGNRMDARTSPAGSASLAEDTEIVCIVRSKSRPEAQSQVVIIDRPSAGFLQQLQREGAGATATASRAEEDLLQREARGLFDSTVANAGPPGMRQ